MDDRPLMIIIILPELVSIESAVPSVPSLGQTNSVVV